MKIVINAKEYEFNKGSIIYDMAKAVLGADSRKIVCGKIDGKLVDQFMPIENDCEIELIELSSKTGMDIYRHTVAHVLAQAVKTIYPNAKLAIGPAIEDGFYYDFDFKTPISQDDFPKIEAEMKKIIKANFLIERKEIARKDAIKMMKDEGENFKIELIESIENDEKVTMYTQGEYVDICRGPHLKSTGMIKAFKLTKLTGAYWRGDEKNKMLTRIYGVAFESKADMDDYFARLEEAMKRDHNKLGRELELFTTSPLIGQGLPILLPKGARMIQLLERFVEDEEEKRGYLLTKTPYMAKKDLYKISGHWDHYRDNMFIMGNERKGEEVFALRPMTCPFQFQAYLNKPRSYKDLPLRYNETSTLFRNESSGEMHGLIRVRQFTISEGHLACTPDQLEAEFKGCLELAKYIIGCLGFEKDVSYRFSKWDEKNKKKYIGSASEWESVQNTMRNILNDLHVEFVEADGEAAFYGPKLDVQMKNVFGKEDTLVTIQIDFQLAQRFGMEYTDQNSDKKYPYIIHRTSLGCYERTLALLIEKYAGAFPMWIAPVQFVVMNVSEKSEDYSKKVADKLRENGFRVELDIRNEKIGYKIRQAQLQKVPYMVILGENEVNNKTVSVRKRGNVSINDIKFSELARMAKDEVESKK